MSFKPYKIHRYSNCYGEKYLMKPGSNAELCSLCGWPLGEHSGLDNCPNTAGFKYNPRFPRQFYKDLVNKNTRTI